MRWCWIVLTREQYGVGLFRRIWAWATPGVGAPSYLAAADDVISPLMVRTGVWYLRCVERVVTIAPVVTGHHTPVVLQHVLASSTA